MKAIKILGKVMIWLIFLLLPVGLCVWMIKGGYPWWVSMLSAGGVVLLQSLLVVFVTAIAAGIKASGSDGSRTD